MSVAWAMVFDEDPPRIFVASDEFVLTRVLALKVVARTHPRALGGAGVERIRDALLEERYGDAVAAWVSATGTAMDVYPTRSCGPPTRSTRSWSPCRVRLSPIFEDPAPPGG